MFRNITPAASLVNSELGDSNQRYAITTYLGSIYLAEIAHDTDRCEDQCRILRYDLEVSEWETVYVDKAIVESLGPPTPEVLCRIIALDGIDGGRANLFVLFSSPLGSFVLRVNGAEYQRVENESAATVKSYFSLDRLLSFKGTQFGLWADQSGSLNQICRLSDIGIIDWQQEIGQLFGEGNRAISSWIPFDNALYAATVNMEAGFQLWRTEATLEQTDWSRVIDKGAYRFVRNQRVFAMLPHSDALFLVAGTPEDERSPDSKYLDYHGFELIRLRPDGTWDLLVGEPRFSPFGLIIPLSGRGSGLEQKRRLEFRCAVVHAGHLFLGTQDEEGFQLWVSSEGTEWNVLPCNDFDWIHQVDGCRVHVLDRQLLFVFEVSDVVGNRLTQILAGATGLENRS